jgi:hypothetical protein
MPQPISIFVNGFNQVAMAPYPRGQQTAVATEVDAFAAGDVPMTTATGWRKSQPAVW